MQTLTIGERARSARVNLETIRYYEREGLIPEPPRTAGRHRAYAPSAAKRLRFIKRALARLKNSCDGNCQVGDCPILEGLDTEVS